MGEAEFDDGVSVLARPKLLAALCSDAPRPVSAATGTWVTRPSGRSRCGPRRPAPTYFFGPWPLRSVSDAFVSRFSGVRGLRRSLPAWLSSFLLGFAIVRLQDGAVIATAFPLDSTLRAEHSIRRSLLRFRGRTRQVRTCEVGHST